MSFPEKRRAFIKQFYAPAKAFMEFSRAEIDVFVGTFRKFDVDGKKKRFFVFLFFFHFFQSSLQGSGSLDAKELRAVFQFM
jgi:hypothetical protein